MTIQVNALTFDADQTLWDFRSVMKKALDYISTAMMTEDSLAPAMVSVEQLQTARERVVVEARGDIHSLEAVRMASFEAVLAAAGHPAPVTRASELTERYMNIRFNEIELYPEVRPVLRRLGQRFKLGLVSNGNTDPDRSGLPGTFDAVVLGPDNGIEKPDPQMFQRAAAQLGVETSQLIHIGDDWDDIEGANRAGATSVLLDRHGTMPAFAEQANHVVGNLIGFEQLVATRTASGPTKT